jgi:5-methylcytosine-specific restriction endonuclease McrA
MVSNSPNQRVGLKKHYQGNKTYYAEKRDRLRERNRAWVLEYLLSHPCAECGEKDPVVLDFDHLSGKEFTVNSAVRNGRSLKSIQLEIDKCQVLCSNCHRRKTARDFGWFKLTPR